MGRRDTGVVTYERLSSSCDLPSKVGNEFHGHSGPGESPWPGESWESVFSEEGLEGDQLSGEERELSSRL